MFSQKQEEPEDWAGLPSEPYDRDDSTDLPERLADPFGLGLRGAPGASVVVPVTGSGSIASVSIPVPVPVEDPADDGDQAGSADSSHPDGTATP